MMWFLIYKILCGHLIIVWTDSSGRDRQQYDVYNFRKKHMSLEESNIFDGKTKRLWRVTTWAWPNHAISIHCRCNHTCWLSLRLKCWIWFLSFFSCTPSRLIWLALTIILILWDHLRRKDVPGKIYLIEQNSYNRLHYKTIHGGQLKGALHVKPMSEKAT